jgi:hypothetical protein
MTIRVFAKGRIVVAGLVIKRGSWWGAKGRMLNAKGGVGEFEGRAVVGEGAY